MVEFVLADPHARVFKAGGTVWMVTGSEPALFRETVELETAKGLEAGKILQALAREAEEGSFAVVESPGGADERTTLFKTLSSTFELYFRVDGDLIQVFDHFRNAMSSVPAFERVPDERAFADHLLFAYEYLPRDPYARQGESIS